MGIGESDPASHRSLCKQEFDNRCSDWAAAPAIARARRRVSLLPTTMPTSALQHIWASKLEYDEQNLDTALANLALNAKLPSVSRRLPT
eukprot:4419926-Pleurochrysis_carterae.AAC.1